jgi:hypothetical protein
VDYVLDNVQLRPLLSFSDLTHVEISAPAGFDLDDATIADMVRAWLHVQTLKFHASNFHVQSNVTLAGLLSLAQYCLQLSHLELSLDASTVSQWEAQKMNTKRVRQSRLTSLYMFNSPIASPLAEVVFLSNVSPKLSHVYTNKFYRCNPSETIIALEVEWKMVEAALPVLRKVWAEEKYWTGRGREHN